MDAVKPAGLDSVRDGAAAQAQGLELAAGHDPVLPSRHLGHGLVRFALRPGAWSTFCTYVMHDVDHARHWVMLIA